MSKSLSDYEKLIRSAAKEYARGCWVYWNQKRQRPEVRPAVRSAFEAGAKWENERSETAYRRTLAIAPEVQETKK